MKAFGLGFVARGLAWALARPVGRCDTVVVVSRAEGAIGFSGRDVSVCGGVGGLFTRVDWSV